MLNFFANLYANGMQPNGSDCIIGNKKSLFADSTNSQNPSDNVVTLYNYIEYFLANNNINQGSNLGSQADGSASSN